MPSRMTEGELDQLISSRLLRLVEYHGAQRIELTHDVLTPAVRENRDRRRAERDRAELAARAAELEAEQLHHVAELQVAHEHARRAAKALSTAGNRAGGYASSSALWPRVSVSWPTRAQVRLRTICAPRLRRS